MAGMSAVALMRRFSNGWGRIGLALMVFVVTGILHAQASFPLGANGRMGLGNRNGDFFVEQDDLRVKVPGGYARVNRDFDGRQWVFNRQWSGLGRPSYYKASYPSMGAFFACTSIDGVSSCDTTAVAGETATAVIDVPFKIEQTRVPNDPYFGRDDKGAPLPDYGNLEFVARKGVGFTRGSDGVTFVSSKYPRYVVRERSVPVLPASDGVDAQPTPGKPGQGGLATTLISGFRWTDRSGQWIEYDNLGRISSYGDANDVRVWFQYGHNGQIERVLDDNGRTVFTFVYSGDFIVEARDHTPSDGSIRRVHYQYDDVGRLRTVTDPLGHATTFEYGKKDDDPVSTDAGGEPTGSGGFEADDGTGGSSGSGGVVLTDVKVDTRANIKKVTDAEGRVTQIAYGATDRIARIKAPDGGVTDFQYGYDKLKKEFNITLRYPATIAGRKLETFKFDQEGRPIYHEVNGKVLMSTQGDVRSMTFVDERNGTTQVNRDNFDEITRITYADGTARTYVYEAGTTDVRQATDEAGASRQMRYDSHGNMLEYRLAVGTPEEQTTEFIANSRGEIELMRRKGGTNPNGTVDQDAELRFTWDANGNVSQLTDGEGKVWKYEYDNQGNLTKATDPLRKEWTYVYDANGNLLSETDPNGHSTSYQYDKTDLLVAETDGNGHVTRYGYDAAGRGTTITDPYGAAFTDIYDQAGQLTSRSDASGQTGKISYDVSGRPIKVVDGENFSTLLDYADGDGVDRGSKRVGKITYPTFQRVFRYDSRKRPIQQTELLGTDALTSGVTHDPRGRIKTATDANGNTQSFEYDGIGRPVAIIDELGATTRLDYDHRNNLIAVTNPKGKVTSMTYDRRDLLLTETNAVDQTTSYQYDDAGNLVQILRPNGVKLTYHYDPAGQLDRREAYRADASLEQTAGFNWDAAGNLSRWQTDRAAGVLTYDDADRLLSEAVTIDGVTLNRAYTYYADNKVKTYTGPDGNTLTYTYDGNGQLARLDIPNEGSISVTDWSWTAPKKIVLPGGTVQEIDRDGLMQLTRLRVKSPNQSTLFELENQFGHLHELSSRKVDGDLTRFDYDQAVRLVKEQPDFLAGTSKTYVIDKAGNRIEQSAVSGTWVYDDANRLLQRGNVTYDYDSAGNLIRKVDADLSEPLRTTRYTYDGYNRLVEVRDGGDAVVATYAYDPFDNRLVKELTATGAERAGSTAGKTLFLQGEEGLLAETDATGKLLRSYGWHPEHPYATYPLFEHAGGAYYYFHNDQLGTPWRVTNRDGATVWSAEDYTAFGSAKVASGAQIVQPWRLPGQYFDAETGLHYNLRRYYDGDIGRYISEDPLGFDGGDNFYAYARHSPTNFMDPTGQLAFLIPVIEGAECLASNYLRCMASCVALDGITQLILDPCNLDWNIVKDCAKDCLWAMIPLPNPCGKVGRWLGAALGIASAAGGIDTLAGAISNSFPGETQVATPHGLRAIESLRPGDKVLAFSEDKGRADIQTVTDIVLSRHAQTIVTIELQSGEKLKVTGGHPVHTPTGWRAAQLLKAGGQLDVKDKNDGLRTEIIQSVTKTEEVVSVYNLAVGNSHTFFVSAAHVLVHNHGNSRRATGPQHVYSIFDELGNLVKYGISGCGKNRHGKSRRAERQLKEGWTSRIERDIPAGPTSRQDALNHERDLVTDYFSDHAEKPPGNKLPNPW